MLCNGIVRLLGLEEGKDWVKVRRELTDEKISRIYLLYEALWPLETDLLKLLPKPDGSIHSSRRVATKAAPASVCISSIASLPTVWVVGPISTANPARDENPVHLLPRVAPPAPIAQEAQAASD
jgi:hypothetical protein